MKKNRSSIIRKLIIGYSPIINLAMIVILNSISLVSYEFYKHHFYILCMIAGISIIQSVKDLCLAYELNYCRISKYSSWLMLAFCPIYISFVSIFGEETIYNIIIQILSGVMVLVYTIYIYIKRNPRCMISLWFKAKEYSIQLWVDFVKSVNESKCMGWEKKLEEKRDRLHLKKDWNI